MVISAVSFAVARSVDRSVICTVVADTNVVVLFDPLYRATDCALKPVPVIVIVVVASPTKVLVGETETVVGDGFNTVKVCVVVDVPPPGVGLVTVMVEVVAVKKSLVVKNAESCVELANTVVREEPFQFTIEPFTKPVPVMVDVAPDAPAIAVLGKRFVIDGTRFNTANAVEVVEPPPGVGLVTTMVDVPPDAVSVVFSVMVSCVELATVGVFEDPLNIAVVFALNPVPVIVSVGAVFVNVEIGEIAVIVGIGLLTVSVCAPDVPPPGVGLVTVIECVPPTAICAAVMVVVACDELTNVVVSGVPSKLIVIPLTKLLPFAVNTKFPPPAVVNVGLILVNVGVGFFAVNVGCDARFVNVPESLKRDVVVAV